MPRWIEASLISGARSCSSPKEHPKDQLVEGPVAKIRFPKYLASSTLKRDGRTYYFVDEDTRRQFERDLAAKP